MQERECDLTTARQVFLNEVKDDVCRSQDLTVEWVTEIGLVDYAISVHGVRSAVRNLPSPDDPIHAYINEIGFLCALGLLGD